MVDKALTVHLRNTPPPPPTLMIFRHYGSKQTEVSERIINHLPFPLVEPHVTFRQIRKRVWLND